MFPVAILVGLLVAQDSISAVHSIPEVDLQRYAGRWYEVARLPNRFERQCVAETTADYQLLPNGELRVINSCRTARGDTSRAEGRARLADRRGPNSRLKVRFAPGFLSFLSMVWGDYWILDLTPDYDAALVGSPDRKYLWVLSRTATLDDSVYHHMLDVAASQGFDVGRIVRQGTR